MPERLSVSNTRWLNLNIKRLNVLSRMKLYASFSVKRVYLLRCKKLSVFGLPMGQTLQFLFGTVFFDRYSDTRLLFPET